ncbi:MAG: hypothetical protein QNJ45_05945 [Ardenticatenaceae bacterium]|nr:hypothetical protein [Ardenticatenaceae bacterium]
MHRNYLMAFLVALLLVLAGCGGGSGAGEEDAGNIDPETGMVINPEGRDIGEPYIVEGEIKSMNLIPSTSPEFLIVAESGSQYRILTQAIGEIDGEAGEPLESYQFQIGMPIRATVEYDSEVNNGLGSLVSDNFTVLSE